MKIYLAGKIYKGDWREDIVYDLANHLPGYAYFGDLERVEGAFPVYRESIFGEHDYAGPYFVGCDHGCFHGDNSHGAGLREVSHGEEWFGGCGGEQLVDAKTEQEARLKVSSLCLNSINNADVVFAWIDSPDCYGTVAELGYAYAKGKPVWIASPPNTFISDMWFMLTMADRFAHAIHVDPCSALRSFLLQLKNDKKIRAQAPQSKSSRIKSGPQEYVF